jgi:hypothetical protein
MKFDKWTVALVAIGAVSLTSAAKAEEQASSVLTALSSTTLSGYVDTSAHWDFGTGNGNPAPYRFNSPSKADGFNLNVVQLRIEKPLDEAEWAAGYRVDLWAGPDANALGTQSSLSSGDFAIRQAYVALRMPVGNGIDWKVGVFDSIIGYESVESHSNPNFTRSYGNSIEPTTHTGVLATYRFSDLVSLTGGIANTVNPVINSRPFPPSQTTNPYAESYKTYMGSIALTAPDSFGFLAGSTLYGGVVNGFNQNVAGSTLAVPSFNGYAGATLATPVTGLRLGAAWDLLKVDTIPNSGAYAGTTVDSSIWSAALYASFQATEKLSLHARAEYISGDLDAPIPPAAVGGKGTLVGDVMENGIYAVTATIQYDLWKNVLTRLEFRWDHSEHGQAFGGSTLGSPDKENAFLLAGNIVYRF